MGRSRLVGAVLGLAALLVPASAAHAGGSVAVAAAGAPVEDLSAGIVSIFRVDDPGVYDLEWHVHKEEATCGPTPAADDGRRIRSRALEPLREVGDTWTVYTTFPEAGRYLVCAWASPTGGGEPVAGQSIITVREPRGRLTVAAPARVAPGRPFDVRLRAASEAWRMVFVAVNAPDVPCAASSMTDRALERPLAAGLVRGAYAATGTVSLSRPGLYRVCGWLQEDPGDPAPEQRVERLVRVLARPGALRRARTFDSQ